MSSDMTDQRIKLALLAIVRRFMMEHLIKSSTNECYCTICAEARKLFEKIPK